MKIMVAASGKNVARDFSMADRFVEGIFTPGKGYEFIEHKIGKPTKASLKKLFKKTDCMFVITGGIDAQYIKILGELNVVPVTGIDDGVQEAVKNYFQGDLFGGGPRCCRA